MIGEFILAAVVVLAIVACVGVLFKTMDRGRRDAERAAARISPGDRYEYVGEQDDGSPWPVPWRGPGSKVIVREVKDGWVRYDDELGGVVDMRTRADIFLLLYRDTGFSVDPETVVFCEPCDRTTWSTTGTSTPSRGSNHDTETQ